MESTGSLDSRLEDPGQRGFDVILVNARYPRRAWAQTDVSMPRGLRQLHSYDCTRQLPTRCRDCNSARLCRQRSGWWNIAADPYQHMQEALMEMNCSPSCRLRHHRRDRNADYPTVVAASAIRRFGTYRDVRCHSSPRRFAPRWWAQPGSSPTDQSLDSTTSPGKDARLRTQARILDRSIGNKGGKPIGSYLARMQDQTGHTPTFDVRITHCTVCSASI